MSQAGIINVITSNPTIPITFEGNTGSAVALLNVIEILGTGAISTSASGNTITISSTGAEYNVTTTAANPYTVLATDDYVGATAGSITITLPAAPSTGKSYIIKDQSGTAGASNITVNVSGGVILIDNATTAVININYGSLTVIWTGSKYSLI